ncbi:hypothetical protein PHMEG_00018836 [Phytophthora megakarya]|uniref:Uncharacterized protein n=1 Tax=Phytophthora megakarya TaxID=4795 RepID=A0A225VVM7_9STRA|nr:hypothetical protein PHMEG_00018836 [Phytophthora megakarya]
MSGDVADCLPSLRPRVAPASLAAEVSFIAGHRELAAFLGQFPLDRLAERMINSVSFIRRLLAKIRHLQAAPEAESNGTLSSETLVARDNFDAMRRERTAMCRHWGQRVQTLKQDRIDSESFLRQGHRDAESRHQARVTELTDQVAQLQAQLRDSEAAHQAAERRADLDVNALVDFLMGNKPKINVMFNWMRLAALLHHFAEGTPIPEGWLTNIIVVALDDPCCECPEYAKPSPRPGNDDSSSGSSGSNRPSVLDLSPPARNKRASMSGSRTGNRKPKASAARDGPVPKRPSPHKPDIHILKARWDLEAYQALVHVPEPAMFHDIVFYFREVRDLNSETLDGIKDYVDFMRVNAKTWWAILHWLTISFLARDAADTDASRDLYDERRRDVKRIRALYEALLKRLFAIAGFPKTLLYEPGLWTLPVRACH